MEVKWFMIGAALIFASMFLGMGLEQYQQNQCRIAGVQAGKSADEIIKICK